MAEIKCPSCGKMLPAGENFSFCPYCGGSLKNEE